MGQDARFWKRVKEFSRGYCQACGRLKTPGVHLTWSGRQWLCKRCGGRAPYRVELDLFRKREGVIARNEASKRTAGLPIFWDQKDTAQGRRIRRIPTHCRPLDGRRRF